MATFSEKLANFVNKVRSSKLVEKLNRPRASIAKNKPLQWWAKNVDPKISKVNEGAMDVAGRVLDTTSAPFRGIYEESQKPNMTLLERMTVAPRGAIKGINERVFKGNQDYYAGKLVENISKGAGVDPALAMFIGLSAEVAIPGLGELRYLSKSGDIAKILKGASKTDDVGKLTKYSTKVDDILKNTKDIKEKAELLKVRNIIQNKINPSRVDEATKMSEFVAKNTTKNAKLADVGKQVDDATARFKDVESRLYKAMADAKGSKKGDDVWQKVQDLKKEFEVAQAEQKALLAQRNNVGSEFTSTKDIIGKSVETPKVEGVLTDAQKISGDLDITAPPIDVKIGTPQDIAAKVVETPKVRTPLMDFEDEITRKIAPLREKLEKIIQVKKLDKVSVAEQRHLGELADDSVNKSFDDLNRELADLYKKYTGKEIKTRDSYIPDPTPGSKEDLQMRIGGNNLFDDIESIYDPAMAKITTDTAHKTGDIAYSYDAYLDSIRYQIGKTEIEAARKGIKVDSQKIIEDTAKTISKEVKETGASNVDIIGKFKKIAENEGAVIEDVIVDFKINNAKEWFLDPVRMFEKMGIRDMFYKTINWKTEVGHLLAEVAPYLEKNDYRGIYNVIKTKYPQVSEDFIGYLQYVDNRKGNVNNAIENAISSFAKLEAEKTLTTNIPRLKFVGNDGLKTQHYVNDVFNRILGHEVKSQTLFAKGNKLLRDLTTKGFLGANVSSALLNLTEIRRLIGTTDMKSFAKGFKMVLAERAAKKSGKGTFDILKKYGTDDMAYYREIFKKIKPRNSKIADGYEKVGDAVMTPFSKTERLKNRWFLHAYEAEGMSKGLKGEELQMFVMNKFRKYALYSDAWGTVGLLKGGSNTNEAIKSLLQFSQYAVRDVSLTLEHLYGLTKADAASVKYMLSYGLSSYVLYNMYEELGLEGWQSAVALPFGISNMDKDKPLQENLRGISPNTSFGIDLTQFVWEFLDGNAEESEHGNVEPYIEQRLMKNLLKRLPAGSQTSKTVNYLSDLNRGYQENTVGNVRYPVTAEENPFDGLLNMIFGSTRIDNSHLYWDNSKNKLYPDMSEAQNERFKSIKDPKEAEQYWLNIQKSKMEKHPEKVVTKAQKQVADMTAKASEIAETTGRTDLPSTINDILYQDAVDDQIFSEISASEKEFVKLGYSADEVQAKLAPFAESKGWTLEQYQLRKLKGGALSTQQKATAIKGFIDKGNIDIAGWYKNGLLTAAVSKELFRMGVIPDAGDFWEKAKMTDSYYQYEELKDMREKSVKGILKAVESYTKDNTSARKSYSKSNIRTMKDIANNKTTLRGGNKMSKKTYKVESLKSILSRMQSISNSSSSYKL